MNTNLYRKFVKILEKWPLDKTKGQRDLGVHLREIIKSEFSKPNPAIQSEVCERQYIALRNISEGHYAKLYHRERTNTATGLSKEECNITLSEENLKKLEESNIQIIKKYFVKDKNDQTTK